MVVLLRDLDADLLQRAAGSLGEIGPPARDAVPEALKIDPGAAARAGVPGD